MPSQFPTEYICLYCLSLSSFPLIQRFVVKFAQLAQFDITSDPHPEETSKTSDICDFLKVSDTENEW